MISTRSYVVIQPVADINAFIFPGLVGVDPESATIQPNQPGSIVSDWEVSEDGLTYTFNLREDWFWSDGEQIDADDVMYTWDALNSGEVETALVFALDQIESVSKVDDFTIEMTFPEFDCDALTNAGLVQPYPSHIAPESFAELPDQDFNLNPNVTAGPYTFGELRPAEAITLIADPAFVDAELGVVNNDGIIYKSVPDLNVVVDQFLAGDLSIIDGPQEARREELYSMGDDGDAQIFTYPGTSWDYLQFNLADPENPQDAFDEDGNPVDQGTHPIFGNNDDSTVRRALGLAVNVEDIIAGSTFGEATQMASFLVPASWAYDPDLAPIGYDPEAAAEMLDGAGWVMGDDGVRVCDGCGTAEDGTEMRFSLITNEENARRTSIITIAQDQWAEIGVIAEIETIEFFAMLDVIDSQTFDAYVLGWRAGYPDRPDATQLFTPVSDVVGGGSNTMSYNNPRFTELNEQARTLPGCDQAERAEIYKEMQAIIQEDAPYLFMFARNGFYGAQSTVNGFGPFPQALFWNVDAWSVSTP